MSTITRVNGSTYFDDTYGNGSNVWEEIDTEINDLVSTMNALDNANIANTPKISGAKLDLSGGGYVVDAGDEMTGTLEHVFDGIWRKLRASGSARLYEGSADVLYSLSYNTEYSSGAWQGRDITGICLKLTFEGDGFHLYQADSASSGTVPTWEETFHINLAAEIENQPIKTASIKDDAVTLAKMDIAQGSYNYGAGAGTGATTYITVNRYAFIPDFTYIAGAGAANLNCDTDGYTSGNHREVTLITQSGSGQNVTVYWDYHAN